MLDRSSIPLIVPPEPTESDVGGMIVGGVSVDGLDKRLFRGLSIEGSDGSVVEER